MSILSSNAAFFAKRTLSKNAQSKIDGAIGHAIAGTGSKTNWINVPGFGEQKVDVGFMNSFLKERELQMAQASNEQKMFRNPHNSIQLDEPQYYAVANQKAAIFSKLDPENTEYYVDGAKTTMEKMQNTNTDFADNSSDITMLKKMLNHRQYYSDKSTAMRKEIEKINNIKERIAARKKMKPIQDKINIWNDSIKNLPKSHGFTGNLEGILTSG